MRLIFVAKFSLFVLGAILYFGALQQVSAQTITVTPASTTSSRITLTASTSEFKVNDIVTVSVVLNPGAGSIAGGQAIVNFDKTFLTVSTTNKGTLFDNVTFTPNTNDVTVNFLNNNQSSISSSGVIGTITFKIAQVGTTNVSLLCDSSQFQSSKLFKSDSPSTNVIDCLNASRLAIGAGQGEITPIRAPNTLPQTNIVPTTMPTALTQATTLPVAGAYEDTLLLALTGLFLIFGGGLVYLKQYVI